MIMNYKIFHNLLNIESLSIVRTTRPKNIGVPNKIALRH